MGNEWEKSGIVLMHFFPFSDETIPAHLHLEFRVYLKSAKTERFIQERRALGFWFKPQVSHSQHAAFAQDFFKTLVAPVDFPRGKECFHTYFCSKRFPL